MKKTIASLLLLSLASWGTRSLSEAHGGAYRGPGDAAPPPASGSGSGASGGGASGGAGGGGNSGGTKQGGGSNAPKGPKKPGGKTRPKGSSQAAADLTTWDLWWGFNKEPYLDLKAAVHRSVLVENSDEFFLGHRDRRLVNSQLRPEPSLIYERVVPALLASLDTERHNEIVTGALIALAKIGEVPEEHRKLAGLMVAQSSSGKGVTVGSVANSRRKHWKSIADVLADFLKESNQEVSETAAVSLGILADGGGIGPLADLLHDTKRGRQLVLRGEVPWRTRAFAAYGLGLVANEIENLDRQRWVIAQLVEAFDGAVSMATPDLAIACLGAIGLVPLPLDQDSGQAGVRKSLRTRSDQIQWLLKQAERDSLPFLVRAQLPTSLARLVAGAQIERSEAEEVGLGHKGLVVSYLLGQLDANVEREVRQSAVLALGALGDADGSVLDSRIRKVLIELSESASDTQLRNFALIALARVGGRGGSDTVVSEVGRGQRQTSAFESTDETRQYLLAVAEKGSSPQRSWAVLGLGVLGYELQSQSQEMSRPVGETLRKLLEKAQTPRDLGALAIASGLRADEDAARLLVRKLTQVNDPSARGLVAIGLGLAGARGASGDIQAVLKKSKYRPEVMRQAAISLGLLGDKDLVPELLYMLQNSYSLSARAALASAIGFIGDARSLDALIAMLGDQEITGGARGFAAVALGLVSDKAALPWNAKLSYGINYRANVETLTNTAGTGILDIL